MKNAFRGCLYGIGVIFAWMFVLTVLSGISFMFFSLFTDFSDDTVGIVAIFIGTILVGGVFWSAIIRPALISSGKRVVPATVTRFEESGEKGKWVFFDSRGDRIKTKFTPWQVFNGLPDQMSVGDTGMLTYWRKRLVEWEPPSPQNPLVDARHRSIFISYAHAWNEDAQYLSQYFKKAGLSVWLDKKEIRTGDQLTKKIKKAIKKLSYFIPLLSTEYWTSEWCIREFELAVKHNIKIFPIKVNTGDLVIPPHIRKLYFDELGEPVFLDIRGKNPIEKLKELSQQMIAG